MHDAHHHKFPPSVSLSGCTPSSRTYLVELANQGKRKMAKMNWDRVRRESQAKRSGSEWIGSDDLGVTPIALEPRLPVTADAFPRRNAFRKMSGCLCTETVNFVGQHRKYCPFRKQSRSDAHLRISPQPFVRKNADCIRKQLSAVHDFLSTLQANEKDRTVESHQKNIRTLIRVLQEELRNANF